MKLNRDPFHHASSIVTSLGMISAFNVLTVVLTKGLVRPGRCRFLNTLAKTPGPLMASWKRAGRRDSPIPVQRQRLPGKSAVGGHANTREQVPGGSTTCRMLFFRSLHRSGSPSLKDEYLHSHLFQPPHGHNNSVEVLLLAGAFPVRAVLALEMQS